MKRIMAVVLVALMMWTGTALAGQSVCACGDPEPAPFGGVFSAAGSTEMSMRVMAYRKSVTDLELSQQQLRNAQLQEQVAQAQLNTAKMTRAKDAIILVTALGGVVVTGGVWLVNEWGQYCERTEVDGYQTLVCPF